MGRWSRRLGIALMFIAAAAALRQVTAGALAQETAQAPRAVRQLRSELNLVVHAPADPSMAVPPPQPTIADTDLEPGFPVKALHTAGSYVAGPVVHTLVGNIDRDPQLEILATGLSNGPLYAWKHDGSLVPGWPVRSGYGVEVPDLPQPSAPPPAPCPGGLSSPSSTAAGKAVHSGRGAFADSDNCWSGLRDSGRLEGWDLEP